MIHSHFGPPALQIAEEERLEIRDVLAGMVADYDAA